MKEKKLTYFKWLTPSVLETMHQRCVLEVEGEDLAERSMPFS